MGLMARLFGGDEHPALAPGSPEAARMERYHGTATAFAERLKDRIEFVPGASVLYAIVGKPPDAFGVAWFEGGEEHNLKSLVKARGLSGAQVQRLSDELRDAYVRSSGEQRYAMPVGKKKVVVTPSATLEQELARIIHRTAD